MNEASRAPVREGEIVAGKYRIERVLGRGGMGVVFAARHLQLDEEVALKFLGTSPATPSAEGTERFLLEARATFRLRSENAVRMLDLGTLPTGHGFIVMDLLDGQDLKQLLAARGPLSASAAARYVIEACGALHEAHALGIIHRDLKPSNLFLAKRAHGAPIVNVLDFGVSKIEGRDPSGPVSRPDMPIGTPKYMALEQWKPPFAVDARTDIYALGVVLYELLTGHVPLHQLSIDERRARLLGGAIPSPKTLREGLGEGICKVTLRCMQAVKEGRFPSADHLAAALHEAVPAAAPRRPKAELGSTAVTAVIHEDVLAQDAALAFADVTEQQAIAPLFDAPSEVTKTEFIAAGGPAPRAVAPQEPPVVTQRGSPGALPARKAETHERPAMTPPRERMLTPTKVDVGITDLAAEPAPPPRPARPIEPMRPRMLTPTQNDPRAKTLQSAVAADFLPAIPVSAPPPPAPPPPASPPPAAQQATWPSHPPPVSLPAPRASTSRILIAFIVSFVIAAGIGAVVILFVLRSR